MKKANQKRARAMTLFVLGRISKKKLLKVLAKNVIKVRQKTKEKKWKLN